MYLWVKALHVIAIIAWMAGLLYIFRLYVNHAMECEAVVMERFEGMEHRLLRFITTPSMLVAVATGLIMIAMHPAYLKQGWLHGKLSLVLGLLVMHGYAVVARRKLADEPHYRTHRYWRIVNEIPTLLMIGIVLLVVVKPF